MVVVVCKVILEFTPLCFLRVSASFLSFYEGVEQLRIYGEPEVNGVRQHTSCEIRDWRRTILGPETCVE